MQSLPASCAVQVSLCQPLMLAPLLGRYDGLQKEAGCAKNEVTLRGTLQKAIAANEEAMFMKYFKFKY